MGRRKSMLSQMQVIQENDQEQKAGLGQTVDEEFFKMQHHGIGISQSHNSQSTNGLKPTTSQSGIKQ